jgi:hypothetical protein
VIADLLAGALGDHRGDPAPARRGNQARNIAKVAAARQLLTLVF